MSYTVPDMLVTEEQGDPTKELFVKEKVGVVKKINFENVAADAISEGCASDQSVKINIIDTRTVKSVDIEQLI